MEKYICEEMKRFREYLDHNNIEWVNVTYSCEESEKYNLYRTQFLHKNKKVSVINGYGSYGGFSLLSGKNEGLLEVMIEGSNPVGWLTCDEAIELIFGDKRKESESE